jgi:Fur family transcriptional regulator, ferric uptake regulator
MDQADRFRGFLRENGLTFTAARRAILEGIIGAEGHFDADELHGLLRKRGETLSAATVYRALPLFVKSGIIKETVRDQGRSHYEHAWGHDHHDHLECIGCGRIIELKDEELEKVQDRMCRRNNFAAVDHRLTIRGYCAACAKKG